MDDLLTSLDNAKVHYSIIAPSDKRISSSYVSSNDYDATYAMTNEIISKGHTDIGFIKGHHKHSASSLRYKGFSDAVVQMNIPINSEWVKEGDFSFDSGFNAGLEMLNSPLRPSVIFASNDYMAAGVMKAAQMKRIKIPSELCIIGFDDSPIAEQLWPSLSTIRQPVEEMACHAAKILLGTVDGLSEKTESKEFKSELILRESLVSLSG
jgi:LacI family transcriptional regulator